MTRSASRDATSASPNAVRVESPAPDSSLVPVLVREYGRLSGEDSFGMRGDTLFLLNRSARIYPVVAEFVLQPGA